MTEYWKSNANHYCTYCGVWMADNPQTRAIHEQGLKHKDNVARRLRELRQKSKDEQRKKEYTEKSLKSIEEVASKKYEEDRKAQETRSGSWVLHKESGYFYNAAIRWYYDEKSGMYYGGDPPDWTSSPPIPSSSLFGAGESKDGKKESIDVGVEKKAFSKFPKGLKVTHSHPLAGIGGYQMPTSGSFGGATARVADSKQETKTLGKRKEPGKPTKNLEKDSKMSKQEKEALERREAARKRVQERTMQAFGLK